MLFHTKVMAQVAKYYPVFVRCGSMVVVFCQSACIGTTIALRSPAEDVMREACADDCKVSRIYAGTMWGLCIIPNDKSGISPFLVVPNLVGDTIVLPYTAYSQIVEGNLADKEKCQQWADEGKPQRQQLTLPEERVWYERSWYYYASVGSYKNLSLSNTMLARAREKTLRGEVREPSSYLSPIGIYIPLPGDKTALGLQALELGGDYFDNGHISYERWSYSVIQHLTGSVGNGLFMRGDLGWTQAKYYLSGQHSPVYRENGTSYFLGVGFAHPISADLRYFFSLGYARDIFHSDVVDRMSGNLGLIF